MKKAVLLLLIIMTLLAASCTSIPDSQADSGSIDERLAQIDAYKETIPVHTEVSSTTSAELSFRGVKFGSTMSEVEAAEILEITQTYSNALDFEPVVIYSYSMQPTYWFNDYGEFYSGTYSMMQSEYTAVIQDLQSSLAAEYGEPYETGYYDYNNAPVTYASNEEAVAAIDSNEAYYYVSYSTTDGMLVELFVESPDSSGYNFYIYYMDPAYMY